MAVQVHHLCVDGGAVQRDLRGPVGDQQIHSGSCSPTTPIEKVRRYVPLNWRFREIKYEATGTVIGKQTTATMAPSQNANWSVPLAGLGPSACGAK